MLDESGYTEMWKQDKSPEAPGRLENLKELVRALADFETLAGFLDHVSLVMENDEQAGARPGQPDDAARRQGAGVRHRVPAGLGGRAVPEPARAWTRAGVKALEEERRLAYVGLTRARRRAIVSHAANRRIYANWQSSIPSRFLDELPEAEVTRSGSAALARDARATAPPVFSSQFPLLARRARR